MQINVSKQHGALNASSSRIETELKIEDLASANYQVMGQRHTSLSGSNNREAEANTNRRPKSSIPRSNVS